MPERDQPRIEPLPPQEWDELLRALITRSPGGVERPLNVFTTLARHPDLFKRWLGFGGCLLDGKIPARHRELVILKTAHLRGSDYEWAQHAPIAQSVGVSMEEIASLRAPVEAGDWDAEETVLLRAVEELDHDDTISDGTWEQLHRRMDDAMLIEFVMLVAHYQLLATTLKTLRVQLEQP